jgi:cytochrome c oxidase subunit IV
MSGDQPSHGGHGGHGGVHVVPIRLYTLVIVSLFVLTWLTFWTAQKDLGAMNTVVALTIAVTKATLVVLIFMHVFWSKKLVWVFVGAAFVWFMIMIAFTMQDFMSRGWTGS